MHPDYQDAAREWEGVGNENRIVKVRVLSPLDLAVSKVSRFSERDRTEFIPLLAMG